jgi:hypothetical protein
VLSILMAKAASWSTSGSVNDARVGCNSKGVEIEIVS